MKTTDWYDGSIKPAYAGVYECEFDEFGEGLVRYFNLWDGAALRIGLVSVRVPLEVYQSMPILPQAVLNTLIRWRGLTESHCKQCGTEMVPRAAIQQTWRGVGDFGTIDIVTLSPGGPGKLVACYKCLECGWSMTL